jgi:hypothetical protein
MHVKAVLPIREVAELLISVLYEDVGWAVKI